MFAVNESTGFTTLYSFSATDTNGFNHDGANPAAGLILSGGTLYGTAQFGGSSGNGTVFALSTNGTGFATLYDFTGGNDGAYPVAGLILSGGMLYGTAQYGGSSGLGTVFALSTNGTGFATLYAFTGGNDGAYPVAGLILSGGTLYGTAQYGGSSGNGAVFAVGTNGVNFSGLYGFSATDTNGINSDGANPAAGVVILGDVLYGTTEYGGGTGVGTVFSLALAAAVSVTAPQLIIGLAGTNGFEANGASYVTGITLQSTKIYGAAFTVHGR